MQKVLLFGGSGLVGSRFSELKKTQFEISAPDGTQVDILNEEQIIKAFEQFKPACVINFAAYTNVEQAEKEKGDKDGLCFRVNATGAKNVASVCKNLGMHLIHISTEYVFDGEKETSPYTEEDKPNPINWYGQTKYFGEQFILDSGCEFTLVRISMPYSANYDQKSDIARFFLSQLRSNSQIRAVEDQEISPTLVDDIANALAVVVDKKPGGVHHVAAKNYTTPFEFAKLIAQTFNLDSSLVFPVTLEEYSKTKTARLLKNSGLDCSKFVRDFGSNILHTVEDGIKLFKQMID